MSAVEEGKRTFRERGIEREADEEEEGNAGYK